MIIRLRREASFSSNELRMSVQDLGIELQFSGIEANNSNGQGERYHHLLCRIFNLIQETHPQLDDN